MHDNAVLRLEMAVRQLGSLGHVCGLVDTAAHLAVASGLVAIAAPRHWCNVDACALLTSHGRHRRPALHAGLLRLGGLNLALVALRPDEFALAGLAAELVVLELEVERLRHVARLRDLARLGMRVGAAAVDVLGLLVAEVLVLHLAISEVIEMSADAAGSVVLWAAVALVSSIGAMWVDLTPRHAHA